MNEPIRNDRNWKDINRISKLNLSGVLLLTATFIFLGCHKEKPADTAKSIKAPAVSVRLAEKATISRTIELTGNIEPVRLARIASPAEGPVVSLLSREGDHVKKDQLLLSIGRTSGVEANMEAASAALEREREEVRRVRKLVESGALPTEQLDNALVRESNAIAAFNRSKEQSGDYQIKAPWDGVVMKVHVTEGDYVTPRLRLIDVFDPASLVIRFAVPEAEAVLLKTGLTMDAAMDAYPNRKLKARVTRVYPDLDRTLRTRTGEAVFTEDVKLSPGMFARLKLKLESHPEAVVVPQEAVMITPAGDQVVYVVEEGKAAQRKIITGIEEGNLVEILSGINAGDSVIVKGNEKIKPGAAVNPIKADGK